MKKLLTILFVVASVLFITPVNAKVSVLDEIADKFNGSKTIDGYEMLLDKEMVASVSDDKLVITVDKDAITYTLDGTILSADIDEDYSYIMYFVLDSFGQVMGYNDGEVLSNANMFFEEYEKYTLANEGFELVYNEEDGIYQVKMDVTKKIPLADDSNYYLKPEEFDFIAEIVEEGTTGNQNGVSPLFVYNIEIGEDESYIYMAEKDELTERAYKSVLSALKVMYNDKVVEDFKEKYPSFDEGSYMLDGYDIDYDAYVDLEEHPMYDGKMVAIIKIDNAYIKDMFMRTEYDGETVDLGSKDVSLDFSKGNTYELGFFDSVSSSDAGFIYKYILEPAFTESDAEFDGEVAYFDVRDGKIVVGDALNSVFKLTVGDTSFFISATKDGSTEPIVLNYTDLKTTEYQSCEYGHDHHRYGLVDVTFNIIFGEKYDVLKGEGQSVNVAKNNELSFEFDMPFTDFQESGKVYVDNELVSNKNYVATKASTVITFTSDYAKGLKKGEHTIKVTTNNGVSSTTFNIVKTTSNPDTGDKIITYIAFLGLSICALVGTKKFLKD